MFHHLYGPFLFLSRGLAPSVFPDGTRGAASGLRSSTTEGRRVGLFPSVVVALGRSFQPFTMIHTRRQFASQQNGDFFKSSEIVPISLQTCYAALRVEKFPVLRSDCPRPSACPVCAPQRASDDDGGKKTRRPGNVFQTYSNVTSAFSKSASTIQRGTRQKSLSVTFILVTP